MEMLGSYIKTIEKGCLLQLNIYFFNDMEIIYNINVVLEILMHFVTFEGCWWGNSSNMVLFFFDKWNSSNIVLEWECVNLCDHIDCSSSDKKLWHEC